MGLLRVHKEVKMNGFLDEYEAGWLIFFLLCIICGAFLLGGIEVGGVVLVVMGCIGVMLKWLQG